MERNGRVIFKKEKIRKIYDHLRRIFILEDSRSDERESNIFFILMQEICYLIWNWKKLGSSTFFAHFQSDLFPDIFRKMTRKVLTIIAIGQTSPTDFFFFFDIYSIPHTSKEHIIERKGVIDLRFYAQRLGIHWTQTRRIIEPIKTVLQLLLSYFGVWLTGKLSG